MGGGRGRMHNTTTGTRVHRSRFSEGLPYCQREGLTRNSDLEAKSFERDCVTGFLCRNSWAASLRRK